MGLILSPLLAVLRKVPIWLWVVLAALVWGGIQHRRATAAGETLRQAQAAAAADEAQALRASIAETQRRAQRQEEVAHDAETRLADAARAAVVARADAGRVRNAFAAYAASAAAAGASAAGGGAAADSALGLCAELLGRAVDRAAVLADLADRSRAAGQACEASYDALRVTP